jgi:hypothetical protein
MSTSRPRMLGRAALEAAVILVGVMLALAADRWVMDLDERAQESDVLERMVVDLRADSAMIATSIENAHAHQTFALRLLQDGPHTDVEDPAAFLADFASVSWSGSLEFTRETWDDLIATGRNSLIRDPAPRLALSRYYNGTERVSLLDGAWQEVGALYGDRAKGVLPVQVRLTALQHHPWWAGSSLEPFVPVDITQDDVARLRRAVTADEELQDELGGLVVVYNGKTTVYAELLTELSELLVLLRGAP